MPACHAGGHEFESFSRLECLPVTQEVTSSNLVRTAKLIRYLSGEFFYAKIQKNGVFVWQFKLIVIFLQIENEIYF